MELRDILNNFSHCNHVSPKSFGIDIDFVNAQLSNCKSKNEKIQIILNWIRKSQPCIVGRLAASKKQNLMISVYVVDDLDIEQGDEYLMKYLQECRKSWKRDCVEGRSNAVLYFFNSKFLTILPPSDVLVDVFGRISNLIFTEYMPVSSDVIYTEAAPLQIEGQLFLYKAGINFFHTTAHLTANHDRRVPGGAMISINSVGHYTNNLIRLGVFNDLEEAVKHVERFAWQSIGNGGISVDRNLSTSWHNMDSENTCPHHERPGTVPEGFSIKNYSAKYHTDILIPEKLTRSVTQLGDESVEDWKWLTFEYFTAKQYELGCIDFGMFHGYPVDGAALYFNPFPPIRGVNSPDLVY